MDRPAQSPWSASTAAVGPENRPLPRGWQAWTATSRRCTPTIWAWHHSFFDWYWRTDADGNATWGPTSRPVPQWTRHGATPVESLGRHGHHH